MGVKCLIVKSIDSMNRGNSLDNGDNSNDAGSYSSCFSTKSVGEHMESCNKFKEKVHSILNSLNIPFFQYNDELTELQENISKLVKSLKYNRLKVFNLNDTLSRSQLKSKERRLMIEKLELELGRSKDDVCVLNSNNKRLMKQRNIFCINAKRLFKHITQLYLNCEITIELH